MATEPTLKLPQSPRVALFRAVDRILRADPVLKGVVKRFYSWEGHPDDKNPLSVGNSPSIRLTPHPGAQNWWSTESMMGTLQIDCELIVKGLCSDDLDNLWYAMERALYPHDIAARQKISNTLGQTYFAHTGLARFSQPAYDPQPGEDNCFLGAGQIQIDYRLSVIS